MDPSAALPQRLRQYEISELVSREGRLRTYRARDPKTQRSVTLKTIPLDLGDRDVAATITQLKNQAQVSSSLRHPGILEVYEYGEDAGMAYLAMEFAEGCLLKPKLRLPIVDAGSAIIQLLESLEYAHRQHVCHLAIHPGCLLLTSKGQLRITDFGTGDSKPGPLAYSSPERLSGASVDARSDIFSVGAWFYELLTGEVAFGDSPEGLKERICHQKERPPSQVKRDVPEVFDSICAAALAKAPGDRYSSPQEFADQVRRGFGAAFGAPPKPVLSNESVVSVFLSTLRGGVRGARSKPPLPVPPAKSEAPGVQNSNTVWSDQALRAVEKQLARYIGPVARVVVKKAAARSKNVDELYQIAAESLESDQERREFLEGHGSNAVALSPSAIPDVSAASEEPTIGQHDPAPVPPMRQVRKVSNPPPAPVVPVPVAPVPMESAERKPKPVAAPKSVSGDADQQVVARLEQLLGKQPESLAGYLAEEPPEVDQVIYGFVSAMEALSTLYASGGKTGGLAPHSVRFDRVGKASIQAAAQTATGLQGATSFGSMGSPRYAAPEMFRETSGAASAAATLPDVYAMGFMFYEILLGRTLFKQTFSGQRSDLDWLRWHTDPKTKAPTLKSLLPSRPSALSDLLQSMMEKDPEARPSDLAEIGSRLRSIAQQSSRTVVARKPAARHDATPAPAAPRTRSWRIAAIIVAALLLAGAVVWETPALHQLVLPAASQPAEAPDR